MEGNIAGSASYDAAIKSLRNMTATYDKIITKVGDVEVTHERVFKSIEASTNAVVSANEAVSAAVETTSKKAEKAVDKAESKYDKFTKKLGGGKVAKGLASVFKGVDDAVKGMTFGKEGIDKLKAGFEGLQKVVPINENTIGLYNGLSDAIGAASVAQEIMSSVMAVAEVVQWAFNAAMAANPIGLIIAGVVALAGAVIYAWNNFEEFRGVIVGVWEVLKSFGTVIKEYVINRFQELLSGITGIGTAIARFFEGDWEGAAAAGQKAFSDLLGTESAMKAVDGFVEAGSKAREDFNKGYDIGADKSNVITFDMLQGDTVSKLFKGKDGKITKREQYIMPQIPTEKKGDLSPKGGIGGGRQVNVGSLIDTLNINVTHLKQSSAEIRDMVTKVLIRAMEDADRTHDMNFKR